MIWLYSFWILPFLKALYVILVLRAFWFNLTHFVFSPRLLLESYFFRVFQYFALYFNQYFSLYSYQYFSCIFISISPSLELSPKCFDLAPFVFCPGCQLQFSFFSPFQNKGLSLAQKVLKSFVNEIHLKFDSLSLFLS